MLDLYWGEFLVQPAPLELSLNYCSNACAYCFANLNHPHRTADVGRVTRLIADYRNRATIQAQLLKEGYPVVVSNKSDPFAASNASQMLPILQALTGANIPVMIQTKGGAAALEALDFLPPSVWYVTLTTLDADLAARIEPHAPSPAERLELMRALTAEGHAVILGLNPYVQAWQPEPHALLQAAKDAGAYGVWIERIHFTTRQIKRMAPWQREVLGEDLLLRGRRKTSSLDDAVAFLQARAAAWDVGLSLYSKGQPLPSGIFDQWDAYYTKLFPTWQGFINVLASIYREQRALISFDQFLEWARPQLPSGTWPIDSYFGSTAHNLWWTHKVPPQLTYAQVLALAWGEPRLSICPARLPAFAYAGKRRDDGQWIAYVDEAGLPILVWGGFEIFEDYWVDVSEDVKGIYEQAQPVATG
jgi:DNA repair photolyase